MKCFSCNVTLSAVAVDVACGRCKTKQRLMMFRDDPPPGSTAHWFGRWLKERGTILPPGALPAFVKKERVRASDRD